MIIWRGWGILVFIFLMVALVGSEWLTRAHFGPDYTRDHHWPLAAALAAAGLATWVVGSIVNRHEAGDEGGYGHLHHLYFVPMQWWGGFLALAAVVVYLVGVASPRAADAAKPAPQQGQITIIKHR